jgi:hypothetical protein
VRAAASLVAARVHRNTFRVRHPAGVARIGTIKLTSGRCCVPPDVACQRVVQGAASRRCEVEQDGPQYREYLG